MPLSSGFLGVLQLCKQSYTNKSRCKSLAQIVPPILRIYQTKAPANYKCSSSMSLENVIMDHQFAKVARYVLDTVPGTDDEPKRPITTSEIRPAAHNTNNP